MNVKEAVEYLDSLPVSDFGTGAAIISLANCIAKMKKGCELCEGMKSSKIIVCCPRCGKKLGEEE